MSQTPAAAAPAVFISHHSGQAETARRLKAVLQRHGLRGWMAPDDIPAGTAFDDAIVAQIERSSGIVLLLCAKSDRSRHVKRELMLAEDSGRAIFPVRIEDIEAKGLAYWLKDYQWIDWFDRSEEGAERLVEEIAQQVAPGDTNKASEPAAFPVFSTGAPSAGPTAGGAAARQPGWIAALVIVAVIAAGLGWFLIARTEDPQATQSMFEPGRYRMTVAFDNAEMRESPEADPIVRAAFASMGFDVTECFLPDVAADPFSEMMMRLNTGYYGEDCRVLESRFGDGRFLQRSICQNENAEDGVRVRVEGRYSRTSIQGDIVATWRNPEFGDGRATGTARGDRLGDCS